jgi:phage terminase large subunit GpA-like protein
MQLIKTHIRNAKSIKKCHHTIDCPHCDNEVFLEWTGKAGKDKKTDPTGEWRTLCPFCERPIIIMSIVSYGATDDIKNEKKILS